MGFHPLRRERVDVHSQSGEQPAVHLHSSWESWVEVHPKTAADLKLNAPKPKTKAAAKVAEKIDAAERTLSDAPKGETPVGRKYDSAAKQRDLDLLARDGQLKDQQLANQQLAQQVGVAVLAPGREEPDERVVLVGRDPELPVSFGPRMIDAPANRTRPAISHFASSASVPSLVV